MSGVIKVLAPMKSASALVIRLEDVVHVPASHILTSNLYDVISAMTLFPKPVSDGGVHVTIIPSEVSDVEVISGEEGKPISLTFNSGDQPLSNRLFLERTWQRRSVPRGKVKFPTVGIEKKAYLPSKDH
jgi:hypothetical protein